MKKNILFSAFAASMLALGFTSCSSEDFFGGSDGTVRMTVGIEKAALLDDETRTQLSETGAGDLKCVWEQNDRVVVSDASGNIKGYLTVRDGVGETFAHFYADDLQGITDATKKLTFIYVGKEKTGKDFSSNTNGTSYRVEGYNYSTQTGTLASLSDKDILIRKNVAVSVEDGEAYCEDIGLQRPFAFAHFTLDFGSQNVKRTNEAITITAKEGEDNGLRCGVNLNAVGDLGFGNLSKKGITVTGGNGNDFYVTIPMENGKVTITPTFTVTIGGKEYTGSLATRNWTANEYVRESAGVGVPVKMTTTEPEIDNTLFGLRWTESNVSSWMDHNSNYTDVYIHSYVPGIPLKDQGIQMKYTNKSTLNVSDNPNIFLFQWDRDFGFVASDSDYDTWGTYTYVPNAYGEWTYKVSTSKLPSAESYDDYFDKIVYLGTGKAMDWCSESGRMKWAKRQFTDIELSAQPNGFRIPTSEEFKKLVPETSGKAYSYSRSFTWEGQTYYPLYARTENGATYVWYYMKSGSANYLSVHKYKGNYTTSTVNKNAIDNDVVAFVDLRLAGSTLAGGVGNLDTQGFYWASDSSAEGYANCFGIILNSSSKTMTIQYGKLPRTYGLSVRCVYED